VSLNDDMKRISDQLDAEFEQEPMTDKERAKFMMLTGRAFVNQEAGYVLEGHSGVFRLHMVQGRCDMVWTRSKKWLQPEPGMTLGFQICTENLFDLAMLSRELSDLVEQAIAVEIQREQDKPTQWEPEA